MIWTHKKYDCSATYCATLGRPCPAAMRMLDALSDSMRAANGVTEENFQMTGQAGLSACETGCMARFVASHQRIRIFCGVSDRAPQAALDRFADVMLSKDPTPQAGAALPERPRALAEAVQQPAVIQARTTGVQLAAQ